MKKLIIIIFIILSCSCDEKIPGEYYKRFKKDNCCFYAKINQRVGLSSYTENTCFINTEVWVKCNQYGISLDYWHSTAFKCNMNHIPLMAREYKEALKIKNKITNKIKLENVNEGCSN